MKRTSINKGIIGILVIVLIGISINKIYSQNAADSVRTLLKVAKRYQNGINCEVNIKKAFKIYNYLALKGSSVAMNELGKLYRNGDGVVQNYVYAKGFFKQASDLGNTSATCNLALMYHKGEGVKQNFTKAFELYDKAAQVGDPRGCYGAGYLIYKGFGVQQNYAKAIEYFNQGAAKGNADCEYMLACYNLAGHDNNQDIEKGKAYLEKSMKHGHAWMEDFTKYNVVDSLKRSASKDPKSWTDVQKGKVTNVKRQFLNNATDADLEGEWIGKVYSYDWSGNKIEKEQDVRLKFSFTNQIMFLQWLNNNTITTTYTAENTGKQWKPLKEKQYDKNSLTRWFIFRSRYDIVKTDKLETLYADFQRFNIDTHEPMQPSVAVLERIKTNSTTDQISITKIFPNPFSNEISIEFSLKVDQNISIEIYNILGNRVYSGSKTNYQKGKNTETIRVNLPKGNYTLYAKGDTYLCSQNIIRK